MNLYTGVVENRIDPLKLGRCQVRVVGLHNHDKSQLKTEDLPWAYPMQPVTSAGISGIGHSPLGPVEGTWVVVMFRDEDEQQPIILGTIGGIPQALGTIDSDNDALILKEDGYLAGGDQKTTTTDTGDTVTNQPEQTKVVETGLAPASSYKPSQDAISLIKKFEGLRLKAYKDSVGIWTVGYGTTQINGFPVTETTVINSTEAERQLMQYLNDTSSPSIYRNCKSLITQSMFDAMCSFVYNLGSGTYAKSALLKELNSSKYQESANLFPDYNKAGGQVLDGLTKRRVAEMELFLKDGIPNVSGELSQIQSSTPPVDSTSTSTGKTSNNQEAVVMGFKDPTGKYPLYINEPDTNKLARHEDIKKTIVRKKELARDKRVVTAQGKTWDQSPIPYNSQYPFNHVYMTESGHVMEFDDTKNSERIHLYHKSGTFSEIDSNGTQVNKIIGDKYEILERNGYVYIKGTANVTIDGDHNVKINNALNVDISGKTTINVFNDSDINVSGTMNLSVKEDLNIRAANVNIEAYAGDLNMVASGTIAGDATNVHLNSGVASVPSVSTPVGKETPELPEFTKLTVLTRGAEAAAHYETPEEGDPSKYIDKRINDGTLDPDEKDSGSTQASAPIAPTNVPPLAASCNLISQMDKFTADLQLSPHFTLGALTKGGARMPVAQMGLTPQEIVCNLKGLAENCLEPIIKRYPGMIITSGFRRPDDVAESSKTSRHYYGEAADIVIPGYDREKHYEAVQEIQKMIPYDQLILEYSGANTVWIHVSFKYKGNRSMAFTMRDHKTYGSMGTYTLVA